jgi:hypothetical protein
MENFKSRSARFHDKEGRALRFEEFEMSIVRLEFPQK